MPRIFRRLVVVRLPPLLTRPRLWACWGAAGSCALAGPEIAGGGFSPFLYRCCRGAGSASGPSRGSRSRECRARTDEGMLWVHRDELYHVVVSPVGPVTKASENWPLRKASKTSRNRLDACRSVPMNLTKKRWGAVEQSSLWGYPGIPNTARACCLKPQCDGDV